MAKQINGMTSVSALSRDFNLCRKTIRNRIKQGWSLEKIRKFYLAHKRFNSKAENPTEIIQQIEAKTGEQFQITINKIMRWSTNKKEIAQALELSESELNQCLQVLPTQIALRLNEE